MTNTLMNILAIVPFAAASLIIFFIGKFYGRAEASNDVQARYREMQSRYFHMLTVASKDIADYYKESLKHEAEIAELKATHILLSEANEGLMRALNAYKRKYTNLCATLDATNVDYEQQKRYINDLQARLLELEEFARVTTDGIDGQ